MVPAFLAVISTLLQPIVLSMTVDGISGARRAR